MTKSKEHRIDRSDGRRQKQQLVLLVFSGVLVIALLVVVLLLVSDSENENRETSVGDNTASLASESTTVEDSSSPTGPELEPANVNALSSGFTAEGFPYLGSPDAPVKMIEFSDFFCGHCGDFNADKAPRIEKEYVATGKVQFIVQYYALGKDARLSVVEASACAADQGRFFEYRRLLFADRQKLAETPSEKWKSLLMQYGEQVGLDLQLFERCWDQGQHQGEVLASIDDARQKGISSTPAFLIGGELLVGNLPYERFQSTIESALAKVVQ